MERIFIGIDPGSKGFISVMKGPEIKYFSIADHTTKEIYDFIHFYSDSNAVCVMEEVHAIYGSSAKSTFSFGEIFGILQALIIANGLPYSLIPPKTWQKEIWSNSDKVKTKGKVDTKLTSINSAMRLFPHEDFRRTPKCTKIDDNKVDSLLIAEYARRRNL